MLKKTLRTIIVHLLEIEARLVLKKYRPKIVGVTGNVGKTSTKVAIALVLAHTAQVRESDKSYNSEIGLPLTILGCKTGWSNPWLWFLNLFEGVSLLLFPHHYPEWLVLEIGADRPGDIKHVASWLMLDVAVITRIGEKPVHVEFFPTAEALAKEKSYMINALGPGGALVLNEDDAVVSAMREKTALRPVTFGFNEGATIRASNNRVVYQEREGVQVPDGITCKVDYNGKSFPLRLNSMFGANNVYAALAAMAVGVSLDLNLVTCIEALTHFVPPPGRLNILEGIKGSVLIDDTYNASPTAMRLALESLREVEITGRRIAVLADMLELGKLTEEAHEETGTLAAATCDLLVVVGQRAKFIADGAKAAGMSADRIMYFDDACAAGKALDPLIQKGDVVLVKGSQFMRMERCVEEIMLHPEKKAELLVRQDPEWEKR